MWSAPLVFVMSATAVPSSPARAYIGTLRLSTVDNRPHVDNVLPFYKFMNNGNEGGFGFSTSRDSAKVSAFESLSDALPDYLLNESHVMPDTKNRALPYRMKDGWTQERKARDIKVATLENEHLRIDVTPLWGGRIHRALHKPTGRYLAYFNEDHTSVNDGTLRSCELGGIEWNWSPGQVGHTVWSENPVYVARLSTSRGDALRIWEYDRWNGTTWQVDLHLHGARLWSHARIINPTSVPLPGYWWTNVQMPMTSGTTKAPAQIGDHGRCRPTDPTWPGSRVISPAWGAATGQEVGGVAGLAMVEWPRFEQCGGFLANMPGTLDARPVAGPPDRSWLSNFTGDADTFLQCTGWQETRVPFIAIADKDLWGDTHGVVHGHGTPFNKIWTMGMDYGHAWSESANDWNGCFVELQVGVAPTQSHTFTLPAHSSHHHSEFWQLLEGLHEPSRLYADDYTDAVGVLTEYLNSAAHGVPNATWDDMDAFMHGVATTPLPASAVLFNGSAWGALDAKLFGHTPPASVVYFEAPTSAEYTPEDATPFSELLSHSATFSAATLSAIPRSFVAGARPEWLSRIVASAEAHGWTWLHHYHVANEAIERFDWAAARSHLNASLTIHRTPHALRSLALVADGPTERAAHFLSAWKLARTDTLDDDPMAHNLRANLAGELAYNLLRRATDTSTPPSEAAAAWDALEDRLTDFDNTFGGADALGDTAAGGILAVARAHLALVRGEAQRTLDALSTHRFVHFYHGGRPRLNKLWLDAQIALEQKAKGRPLTHIERKHVKYDPARAPPATMGAIERPDFTAPPGTGWP